MSAPDAGPGGTNPADAGPGGKCKKDPPPPPREGTGWAITSYLIGGMLLYGGIGWLIARWTDIPALFPIGLLLGLGLAIALVIFRFVRPS